LLDQHRHFAGQPQRCQELLELLQDLAFPQAFVNGTIFAIARLKIGDVDHAVLEVLRQCRRPLPASKDIARANGMAEMEVLGFIVGNRAL
jgi:hypothetical protein